MLETLSMDYIRTARSKGIPERTVLVKHGFRAAMSPIVTILGLDIAALLTGTLITEQIFGVDGIGRRTLAALPRPGPARHHGQRAHRRERRRRHEPHRRHRLLLHRPPSEAP